jgi:SNF2 family DNA or RNA helicase
MYVEIYTSSTKGWLDLRFKYDEHLVNIMRSLKNRKWNKPLKVWQIPAGGLPELQDKLAQDNIDLIDKTTISEDKPMEIWIREDGFVTNFGEVGESEELKRLYYIKRPRDGYRVAELLKSEGYDVNVVDNVETVPLKLYPNVTLYPYQEECMQFLRKVGFRGLVALDVGLGKTIVACKAIDEIGKGPILIVAPASLLYQWKDELNRHFGYEKAKVVTSRIHKSKRLQEMRSADIIITNYEFLLTLEKLDPRIFFYIQWELVIFDEMHRLKNWKAKTSQVASKLIARRVIGLTGTPVVNKLQDLYHITDQIQPAFFGTMGKFYKNHIRRRRNEVTYQNLEGVYKKLDTLMFRKLKTDPDIISQLPKLTRQTIPVILSAKEAKGYEQMIRKCNDIGSVIMNSKVFASSSGMRMEVKKSSKEKALIELLNDIQEKAIVVSFYKQELDRLEKMIDRDLFRMDSSVSKIDRDKECDKFALTKSGVMLMTEVGTEGLDKLKDSNTLINFDIPWTHKDLTQREGRVHRQGSKHDKNFVFNMISKGTIDEHILNIIANKKELSDITVNGVKEHVANEMKSDLLRMGIKVQHDGTLAQA